MTKSTRYFLLGSATVLTVGLCTGLVAYYAGLPTGAFSGTDTHGDLAYVPADATMVAVADVQAVMQSPLRQHLKPSVSSKERGAERLLEETGINIETDIDRVTICALARPDAGPKGGDGFAVIRGRFDDGRLEGLARAKGAQFEEYRGKRLVKTTAREGQGPVLAFVEPGTLLVGSESAVKWAMDQKASGHNVVQNGDMMRLLTGISGDAWAVGRADALKRSGQELPNGLPVQMPAIEWFAASGELSNGLAGSLRAEAKDEEAARNLREVVQGFVAMGRLQSGQHGDMQALMDTVQMGGSGKTVTLGFSVPAALIEKMLSKHEIAAEQ
ncbi:MAG: hypothetical protein U0Q12_15610 [Vicinamibacterales bacterium]